MRTTMYGISLIMITIMTALVAAIVGGGIVASLFSLSFWLTFKIIFAGVLIIRCVLAVVELWD